MKMLKSIQAASIAAIVSGLILLAALTFFWLHERIAAAHPGEKIPQIAAVPSGPHVVTGNPDRVTIPSLHIDLQVVDGSYDAKSGDWTLTLDKVQFALPSVQPNNVAGNTLIYGHYRPEVFAYLHLVQTGAEADVYTANGYKFTYTYTATRAYDPTDTSIFLYKGPPRLTIQTCSGSFFQHRQMYFFKYDGYTKR